jgi:hypothetical protein
MVKGAVFITIATRVMARYPTEERTTDRPNHPLRSCSPRSILKTATAHKAALIAPTTRNQARRSFGLLSKLQKSIRCSARSMTVASKIPRSRIRSPGALCGIPAFHLASALITRRVVGKTNDSTQKDNIKLARNREPSLGGGAILQLIRRHPARMISADVVLVNAHSTLRGC